MKIDIIDSGNTSLYKQMGIVPDRANEIGENVRIVLTAHLKVANMPGGTNILSNGLMLQQIAFECHTNEELIFATVLFVRLTTTANNLQDVIYHKNAN